MKRNSKFKISMVLIVIIIIAISAFIFGIADGFEPGSEGDPIVTLSFVDKKFEQLKYYIDSSLRISQSDIDSLIIELEKKDKEIEKLIKKVEDSLTFEVVELKKGQILLANEGAELIIRSGNTTAVYGEKGGLSDITSAKDLKSGESIKNNHMLIASRGDGRGVKAETIVFLIIKGGYSLK